MVSFVVIVHVRMVQHCRNSARQCFCCREDLVAIYLYTQDVFVSPYDCYHRHCHYYDGNYCYRECYRYCDDCRCCFFQYEPDRDCWQHCRGRLWYNAYIDDLRLFHVRRLNYVLAEGFDTRRRASLVDSIPFHLVTSGFMCFRGHSFHHQSGFVANTPPT